MKRPKYFTPNEVSIHNNSKDIWVSYLGKVYNLTPLIEEYAGKLSQQSGSQNADPLGDRLLKPIIDVAGQDISNWFDPKTKDIKTYIDPITNCQLQYTPHGRFLHIAPPYPSTSWANDFRIPWWKDEKYCIGVLSKKTRFLKIINGLTLLSQVVEVCSEENMLEILQRYLKYNSHASSYTWKYDGRVLDMDKTLSENDIHDDDHDFYTLRMKEDEYLQSVILYYNDDLTEL
jgi:hypothetical protein